MSQRRHVLRSSSSSDSEDPSNNSTPNSSATTALVRLALASHCVTGERRPINRKNLAVYGIQPGRHERWQDILAGANGILADVWGMKLVPLPSSIDNNSNGKNKKRKNPTTNSGESDLYVLVSLLRQPERTRLWTGQQDDRYLGLLWVIVAFLALSPGHSMDQESLWQHLSRLGILPESTFHIPGLTVREWLGGHLKASRYIEVQRDPEGQMVYALGPRARLEFPRDSLIEAISALVTEDNLLPERLKHSLTL